MTAFNTARLISEGRNHWKKYLPKLHAALNESGQLQARLETAAAQTRQLLDSWNELGYTDAEAWPEVRSAYLILDPREHRS